VFIARDIAIRTAVQERPAERGADDQSILRFEAITYLVHP
jgi:hypothetical protein